jgi:hypothetical protein
MVKPNAKNRMKVRALHHPASTLAAGQNEHKTRAASAI